MKNATAPATYFDKTTNGDVHTTFEPSDDVPLGTILDKRGDVIERPGWMVRIDTKAKEQVTISKGTIWLVGVVPVFASLMFYWGSAAIGIARDDQKKAIQIEQMQTDAKEMREDMRELKIQFNELQKMLNAQAIKNAENEGKVAGYGVGRTDQKAGH